MNFFYLLFFLFYAYAYPQEIIKSLKSEIKETRNSIEQNTIKSEKIRRTINKTKITIAHKNDANKKSAAQIKQAKKNIDIISKKLSKHDSFLKQGQNQLLNIISNQLDSSKLSFNNATSSIKSQHNRVMFRRYLKCLKSSLKIKKEVYQYFKECDGLSNKAMRYSKHTPAFWQTLSKIQKDYHTTKKKLENMIFSNQESLRKHKKIIENNNFTIRKLTNEKNVLMARSQYYQEKLNQEEAQLNFLKKEYEQEVFKEKNKVFLICNQSTKTIDLEQQIAVEGSKKKGTLFSISQDNQDGIGSCYANTAKNILSGLSAGKIDASFLDMALQHKVARDKNLTNIDGGTPCSALKQILKHGYCPKKHSPIEMAESIFNTQGLFAIEGNIEAQAKILEILSKYLKGKLSLKQSHSYFATDILKKTKKIVKALREDSNIRLPFPKITDNPLQEKHFLESAYLWQYKKNLKRNEKILSFEEFEKDFIKYNTQFKNKFIKNLNLRKTNNKQLKTFKETFRPFFEKYHLLPRINDSYMSKQIHNFILNNNDSQKYIAQVNATMNFYQKFFNLNKEEIQNINSPSCKISKKIENYFDGINEMNKLKQFLTQNAFEDFTANYLDSDPKELLQLAIAPKCLHKENRIKLNFNINCNYKSYRNEKNDAKIRYDIIKSLLSGIPVGRTFPPSSGGLHIHSIVGFRYNPETQKCEYKIRESMKGESYWANESELNRTATHFTFATKDKL
ncbi:MAG: hypothetical protein N4A33_00300 [Bacteriovoracaceae bacterium]|jgi:hypothetical protein|nr:hypothetical protein [Bacteriovoracaceae bacterium]